LNRGRLSVDANIHIRTNVASRQDFDSTSFMPFGYFRKKLYLCRKIKIRKMGAVFSNHAEEQLVRRSLERSIVERVILNPDQIVKGENSDEIAIF